MRRSEKNSTYKHPKWLLIPTPTMTTIPKSNKFNKNKDCTALSPPNPVVCTPTCGPNAIFSNCASACPITCKNYPNPPKYCIQVCVKRCKCLNGRILNNKGECVLPNECY
uniref:TIL domain-containing protein n=1 Tax=Vespula pensylvanica TaxID=30213 RepID=A0A834PB69_VESPE|nr:hypothetical protein H0235_003073 [Vespula pensylvanica]